MTKKKTPEADTPPSGDLKLERELQPGETPDQHMAKLILDPAARHAFYTHTLAYRLFKGQRPDSLVMIEEFDKRAVAAETGDTAYASAALSAQAHTLDAMFTDLAWRAHQNAANIEVYQRYMAMAFKAQANCRTTLETLTKMHQPREQVVRHVHVYEGGQAVVAEEFHHHARGLENAGSADQSHAQGAYVAPLPSPNPIGQSVPVAKVARKKPVPDARRTRRGAEGK